MELRLPFPPEPAFMEQHAQTAVALVAEFESIHLDYGTSSLEVIDEVIATMRDGGEALETVSEALFAFGAYVGEVLVRTYDCAWISDRGQPKIKLPGGQTVDPVGRAFRAIADEDTRFVEFLQVLVTADQAEDQE